MAAAYACLCKLTFVAGQKERLQAPTASSWGMHINGINQHGQHFVNILTYGLNTLGQGARYDMDGENAHGFSYAPEARGSELDETETLEPYFYLFQKHLKDYCGLGKYRSGVGTVHACVAYASPQLAYTCVARESKLHPATGLFGGYPSPTAFGVEIRNSDVLDKMSRGDIKIPGDLWQLLSERSIEGDYWVGPHIRSTRKLKKGDIFVGVRTGSGGYGDVLDRDPDLVMQDIQNEIISHQTAVNVCKVVYDHETLQVDYEATKKLREKERQARLQRGKKYTDFEKDWLELKPPEETLKLYGSWPDAKSFE